MSRWEHRYLGQEQFPDVLPAMEIEHFFTLGEDELVAVRRRRTVLNRLALALQIGGGETDVIMLVMNQAGADKLMKSSKFTIGGEGSAMAGPVGAKASTNTEALMKAEMLTYSRSKGAFAGVTLSGSSIKPDDGDNKKLYGKEVKHEDILQDKVPAPATANELIATLTRYSVVPK